MSSILRNGYFRELCNLREMSRGVLVLLLLYTINANRLHPYRKCDGATRFNGRSRCLLTMKWNFSKGNGKMKDLGGIGSQGEYYYIPSKRPSLDAPVEALGKELSIPIFPRNQVLAPLGTETLMVYEMRYRQLINDVGDNGRFGHIYYSQENGKLALVGTLVRLKKIERLEDGGMVIVMEGTDRFYLKDIHAEKPYLKARVHIYNDYCENELQMEELDHELFEKMRYSVKLMKNLHPMQNYTVNEGFLRNRPPVPSLDQSAVAVSLADPKVGPEFESKPVSPLDTAQHRRVELPRLVSENTRRSELSYASLDMLRMDPATKLLFMQEPVLEKRFIMLLKVS